MNESDEIAETAADLVKQKGIRRYLWLYFIIVPLAAATASTVAIFIAAIQGLGDSESALRLYALVALLGIKLIAGIGLSYFTSLLLTAVSFFFFWRRREMLSNAMFRFSRDAEMTQQRNAVEQAAKGEGPAYSMLLRDEHRRMSRLQSGMLVLAVLYGAAALVTFAWTWMGDDFTAAIDILHSIAFSDTTAAETNTSPVGNSETGGRTAPIE